MTRELTAETVAGWRAELGRACGGGLSDPERLALLGELEGLTAAVFGAQSEVAAAFEKSQVEVISREIAERDAADSRAVPLTTRGRERLARRSVVSQVALALRTSPSRGQRFLALADRLTSGELGGCASGLRTGRLSREKVEILDRALAPLRDAGVATVEVEQRLAALGEAQAPQAFDRAARTAVAAADPAAVVAAMSAAVASRRVSVRPAPDGMARLSVLGPMVEVVGAYAALTRAADTARGDGRSRGQVLCDTALERLSGRTSGQPQPVEVQLVMTEATLLDAAATPAQLAGFGPVPAALARDLVLEAEGAGERDVSRWLRRLYTAPATGELVALDSRRRTVVGGLRRFVGLRDQRCRTPFCDAPVRHLDHVDPARAGGPTSAANTQGLCEHCHLVKETPGWRHTVLDDGLDGTGPQTIVVRTPTGATYRSQAPPLLGWGAPSEADLPPGWWDRECPPACTEEGWLSETDLVPA